MGSNHISAFILFFKSSLNFVWNAILQKVSKVWQGICSPIIPRQPIISVLCVTFLFLYMDILIAVSFMYMQLPMIFKINVMIIIYQMAKKNLMSTHYKPWTLETFNSHNTKQANPSESLVSITMLQWEYNTSHQHKLKFLKKWEKSIL